jgi:hypothetical protein
MTSKISRAFEAFNVRTFVFRSVWMAGPIARISSNIHSIGHSTGFFPSTLPLTIFMHLSILFTTSTVDEKRLNASDSVKNCR